MAIYNIRHVTKYTYTTPVIDSANQIMLYPITDGNQEVGKHDLTITHNPSVEVYNDYFGNRVGLFTIIKPHEVLNIQSEIEVTTYPITLPADDVPPAQQWENLEMMKDEFPYVDFLTQEAFDASNEVKDNINRLLDKNKTPFVVAQDMSSFVYNSFEYKKGITSVETKIDEVWKLKAGVCQDFAHILLVMLRIIGIPARYVSGYICPKNNELRGEGATHAWVDAYIPNYGWIGLDPTNNCIVNDRHVRLAVGRNFSDCTPVKGTYKGSSEHTLEVYVTIENETPKEKNNAENFVPSFTYKSHNPNTSNNSYRHFMEMQQQQ